MYVCICKSITQKQVEEASHGARSLEEVCKKLGIGQDCGSCLNQFLNDNSHTLVPRHTKVRPVKQKSLKTTS